MRRHYKPNRKRTTKYRGKKRPRLGNPPSKVPGSVLSKLVELYGKKLIAIRQQATVKIQQRMHDKFERYYETVAAKYGTPPYEFWTILENKANKWADEQLFAGTGRDW